MNVLTEIVIGAVAIVFTLKRMRMAGKGTPRISRGPQETVRPAIMQPPRIRVSIGPDPAAANRVDGIAGPDAPDRPFRQPAGVQRRSDPTQPMMDAMSGPGVCTPRP